VLALQRQGPSQGKCESLPFTTSSSKSRIDATIQDKDVTFYNGNPLSFVFLNNEFSRINNTKNMKNIVGITMLAVSLLIAQSCGPKKDSSTEAVAGEKKEVTTTAAERKATFEKQQAARTERRKLEYEERLRNTPTYTDTNGNLVYNKAELEPAYVGGNDALTNYLKDNLVYPQEALDKQEEGLVFVDFVVAKNGTIREVEVTEQTNEDVDVSFRSEAARVVSAMPGWTPGRQKGKAVDVKFSLPISFQLH
jgi:TonB family protein